MVIFRALPSLSPRSRRLKVLLPFSVWWTWKTPRYTRVRKVAMGVSKNRGTPKWMVKIMENPIKMGWFGGTTIFWKHPYVAGHLHVCHRWSCSIFQACWINISEKYKNHAPQVFAPYGCFSHIFPKVPLVKKRLIETTSVLSCFVFSEA